MAERISIHALFAEGDMSVCVGVIDLGISIHALFAEGDLTSWRGKALSDAISIHALFAEGDSWYG